jgi:hypothetical protein
MQNRTAAKELQRREHDRKRQLKQKTLSNFESKAKGEECCV